MADLRHRPWLQHREFDGQQAAFVRNRRVQERALQRNLPMSSAMKAVSWMWLRATRSARDLWEDRSAIAATEFAVIVPIMLVLFFGTVEFSSGVAVDRKVTLVARTLSDLTSQALNSVNDTYLQNAFTASIAIVTPYPATPIKAQISQIYVDSSNVAKVVWSKGAT